MSDLGGNHYENEIKAFDLAIDYMYSHCAAADE
jgi:hypothetical protein